MKTTDNNIQAARVEAVARREPRRLWLRVAAGATLSLLVAGAGLVWHLAFRAPGDEPLPLPGGLVSAATPQGQRLLAESTPQADHAPLSAAFERQRRPAFCGVASSVMVLNALHPEGPRLTQDRFFDDWPTEMRVTFNGMTLQELAGLLRQRGAHAEPVFAQDSSLEAFRAIATANLGRPGDYILVNYQRATLGQRAGGHISPLAAYHPATDRFLLLDVAAYRYPPTWVTASDLWAAMNTLDDSSGKTRGFVLVRGTPRL
ncbi:phytochelatin synthase family protein [Ideonella sp. YS5]|uniref:phytochelatin synthase family protein n=1 Tax=Ideonella sp. YS5 TaxID=3453714 RepID=UPI003EEB2670